MSQSSPEGIILGRGSKLISAKIIIDEKEVFNTEKKLNMWKAIINWINSKSYRCEHNWEIIQKINLYFTSEDKMPYASKHIYRCTKCCESKTIKT